MGGGLPAAAFGGRADVMSLLAPLGPVYQAGTLSGNPLAVAAGLATLRAARRGLRRRSTRARAEVADAGVRRAARTRASPHRSAAPAACSASSSPTATSPTTRRRSGRTSPATPPSSTRCSTPASTCRRALRGLVHLGRTRRRGAGADRRRAAGRGHGGRRPTGADRATPVRRTARERETAPNDGPPAAPRRGAQPHQGALRAASRLPAFRRGARAGGVTARFLSGRDIVAVISSPLERAQQTAEPIAAAFGLEVGIDPRIIESSNHFEGGVVEPGPGILRHPQHWRICATRSARRGVRPTPTSPLGSSRPSTMRAPQRAATRSCWSATSCRSSSPAAAPRGGRCGTGRTAGSARSLR